MFLFNSITCGSSSFESFERFSHEGAYNIMETLPLYKAMYLIVTFHLPSVTLVGFIFLIRLFPECCILSILCC